MRSFKATSHKGNFTTHVFCVQVLCCLLSHVRFFAIPWTVAHQAPLSTGILQARILEWVAILFSREFPNLGIKRGSPALQVGSLPVELPRSSALTYFFYNKLYYKESWRPKNWCFWTVVLEKTLESPLDCKEIQPVHSKGNQSWIFIGRTDAEAEAEALTLWPPDAKNWLIWKDPDVGKDWRQEEKGITADEMVGWHHWLNRHEFE